MLSINPNGYQSPDGTYFRTSAAEPELEQDEQGNPILKLVNGTGTRRNSWGAPGVTSTIVLHADTLVAIHVGFFHKHGGGQFYRYYRMSGQWQQVRWAQLTDDERLMVLDSATDRAPSWAKAPGKLRSEYRKPVLQAQITYKLVEVIEGRYFSVYDRKTEYVMGKRLAERAFDEHRGGYYSYSTIEGVENRFSRHTLFPEQCYERTMELALIECEISGTMLHYGQKIASTYLRPIKIVKQFHYSPLQQKAC